MSRQDTIISLLREIDKNIDNVGGGGTVPKVKVSSFTVNNDCVDDTGYWINEVQFDWNYITSLKGVFQENTKIKYINVQDWDVSNVTSLANFLDNADNLKRINGLEQWNITNKCIYINRFFVNMNHYDGEDQIFDLRNWDVSNVTTLVAFIAYVNGLYGVNIEGWDTRKVTSFYQFFYKGNVKWVNAVGISVEGVPNKSNTLTYVFKDSMTETIVGDYDINDVISKNLKVFDGLKFNFDLSTTNNLNRASLRALINGLADLTGQTAQTLTLGETLIAKLTEEDIAIATAKNWTIA